VTDSALSGLRLARSILHNRRPMDFFSVLRGAAAPPAASLRRLLWLCLLAAASAQAQVLVLEQALATAADTEFFPLQPPPGSVAQMLTLPDDWSASRPGQGGAVWYRMRFDAADARAHGELMALYIERACSAFAVLLNGKLVYSGGRMSEPISRHCARPHLVALPAQLIEPSGNTLDIKLVGHAQAQVASRQRVGGLSRVVYGSHAELAARHGWRFGLAITVPQLVTGVLLLMGTLMFAMGWFNSGQSHLLYFGGLLAGWGLMSARLWLADLPWRNLISELLLVTLASAIALAAVQFLLRYGGQRSRSADLGLPLQCALVPSSLVIGGAQHVYLLASLWYGLLAAEVGGAAFWYLRQTAPINRRQFWFMAATFGLVGLGVLIELLGQQFLIEARLINLSRALVPVAFMVLGLRLVQQVGDSQQHAESGRLELQQRVREATAQIERNFAQMAELRVEQVTERERKRIAADLHDDLGAKLLTIVHTSDNERIATLAREALEEMRLSVRGLTGKPVRLLDALGDWRAEVVSRLGQAGVEGEWHAPGEEVPQTLSARAYVQTTRILREAVSNIIKHSGASRCTVRCAIAHGDFQLVVQDNGSGIPMELDGRLDRGHGMSTMKHRAKQMQGQCLVESGPGYGTVIRLTLPLEGQIEPG
jgi:two-component system, NarL family, sensor histidine kinase UhpB